MKFQSFRPSNDFLLLRIFQEDNSVSKGGIVAPEKYRAQSNRGIVVSFGPKVEGYEKGDRVTFGLASFEAIIVDDESLLIVRENDIRGVEPVSRLA